MHRQQAAEYKSLRELLAATRADRALERQLVEATHAGFELKVQPGCLAGIEVGNSYAGESAAKLLRHPCANLLLMTLLHALQLANEMANNRALLENVASLTGLYLQHLV